MSDYFSGYVADEPHPYFWSAPEMATNCELCYRPREDAIHMTDIELTEGSTNDKPPAFVPDPDGEAGPERHAEHPGWAYALSSDATSRAGALAEVETLLAGYVAAVAPSMEIKDHLRVATAVAGPLLEAVGQASDKVVVRIGGRATPGHANVPGPDESITITVAVVDVPEPPEDLVDESAPIVVDGGSFLPVE